MNQMTQWPYKAFNRGRWPNDLGTLNLLGPDCVKRAVASIMSHEVLSLGAPLRIDDAKLRTDAYEHQMVQVGKYDYSPEAEPVQSASDKFSVAIHGMTNSHIDAFSHVGHRGLAFNDVPFQDVVSMEGAKKFSIMDNPAIVTRAWLVDVPKARGLPALRPGTPVLPADIAHLEGHIAPGDALVIRTGRYATKVVTADDPEAADNHGNWSGLHVDCLELVEKWDVVTVATDSSGDNFPSTTPECSVPIHVITESYLGLPLIHHLDLEAIATKFIDRGRTDFYFCVAPLKVVGGTGSPVSPTAVI
jgi:kynurenine formamidase